MSPRDGPVRLRPATPRLAGSILTTANSLEARPISFLPGPRQFDDTIAFSVHGPTIGPPVTHRITSVVLFRSLRPTTNAFRIDISTSE